MRMRLSALLLTLCMVLTMVPAFAAPADAAPDAETQTVAEPAAQEQQAETEETEPQEAEEAEPDVAEPETVSEPEPVEDSAVQGTVSEDADVRADEEEPTDNEEPEDPDEPTIPYTDMADLDEETQNALLAAVDNGLLSPQSATKMNPNGALTRASASQILVNVLGVTKQADISAFTDVKKTTWQGRAMAKAYRLGIISPVTSKTMKPSAKITREQGYQMLARALHVELSAMDGAKTRPQETMTRADMALALSRLIDVYIDADDLSKGIFNHKEISGSGMIRYTAGDIKIYNSVFDGDLYVSPEMGSHKVILRNVGVAGRVVLMGGKLSCRKETNSTVDIDDAIYVYADSAVAPLGNDVVVEEGCTSLKLSDTTNTLTVNGNKSQVSVVSGATVQKAVLNGTYAKIYGKGKVKAATLNGRYSRCTVSGCKITDKSAATLYGGKLKMGGDSSSPAGKKITITGTVSGINKTTAVTVYWYVNGKQVELLNNQKAKNNGTFTLNYTIPASTTKDLTVKLKIKDKYGNTLSNTRTVKHQELFFPKATLTLDGTPQVLKGVEDKLTAKLNNVSREGKATAIWYVNGKRVSTNNSFWVRNNKTATYTFKQSEPGTYRVTFKLISKYDEIIKANYTVKVVKELGYTVTLGTYTTRFSPSQRGRSTNLRLATKAINGIILQPGESFSFNGRIGERTAAKGYQNAYVIEGGEYVMGLGGGICQVSSTLFNACLRANMRITERRYHTISSTYVPTGADATVAYGSKDYKFVNNYDTPVKIIGTYNSGGTLTMTLKTTSGSAPKDVSIKITHSGKTYCLRRYVNGNCNYTTYSHYSTIHADLSDPNAMFYVQGD